MKIGAHQSIAGGLHMAPTRAREIGLECFQMFTKAPQSWQEPELTAAHIRQFIETCERTGYNRQNVAVHASYLVNPCSANDTTRDNALNALIADARRCDALRIPYLVFHPGSPGKLGPDTGIHLVAEALIQTIKMTDSVTLLIENTAGSGKGIGHDFQQIAAIMGFAGDHPRIGCFDTAHAFAAGYPMENIADAERVFQSFDKIVGLHRLKWMHLNDSRTGKGSRVDRHERIGKGRIGQLLFSWLVKAPFAKNVNGTLETPLEKGETYQADVKRMIKFRDETTMEHYI